MRVRRPRHATSVGRERSARWSPRPRRAGVGELGARGCAGPYQHDRDQLVVARRRHRPARASPWRSAAASSFTPSRPSRLRRSAAAGAAIYFFAMSRAFRARPGAPALTRPCSPPGSAADARDQPGPGRARAARAGAPTPTPDRVQGPDAALRRPPAVADRDLSPGLELRARRREQAPTAAREPPPLVPAPPPSRAGIQVTAVHRQRAHPARRPRQSRSCAPHRPASTSSPAIARSALSVAAAITPGPDAAKPVQDRLAAVTADLPRR